MAATAAKRKIFIDFPPDLFEEMEKAANELQINRGVLVSVAGKAIHQGFASKESRATTDRWLRSKRLAVPTDV